MGMTMGEARRMRGIDMIDRLHWDVSNSSVIRRAMSERMAVLGLKRASDLRDDPSHNCDSTVRPQEKTRESLIAEITRLARDPYKYTELYHVALDNGFAGEGMYGEAVTQMRAAVLLDEPYDDLIDEAKRFVGAARHKILMWAVQTIHSR
jgi:hypothetical protein